MVRPQDSVLAILLSVDGFLKHKLSYVLFGPLARGLPFLWTVRAIEPDFLTHAVVQDRDGVAIGDADDLAGEGA